MCDIYKLLIQTWVKAPFFPNTIQANSNQIMGRVIGIERIPNRNWIDGIDYRQLHAIFLASMTYGARAVFFLHLLLGQPKSAIIGIFGSVKLPTIVAGSWQYKLQFQASIWTDFEVNSTKSQNLVEISPIYLDNSHSV